MVSQGATIAGLTAELRAATAAILENEAQIKVTKGAVATADTVTGTQQQALNALATSANKADSRLGDLDTVTKAHAKQLDAVNVELKKEQSARIRVYSAGYCDGNKVQYFIDGKRQQQRGGRGMHVITFDMSGDAAKVKDYAVFDTHAGSDAALAAHLKKIPDGTLVGFGIADAGTDALSVSSLRQLKMFGSKYIQYTTQRESWAMLSLKGTYIGQALEGDGGHASGLKPKGGCGGGGQAAAVEGTFLLGGMHLHDVQISKQLGQIPANLGELSGLRASHSGVLYGGGDWPKCTDKPGYFSIGTVRSGGYHRYWKVWIYGSHRGYHRDHYMEVQHHIITCGDKCSSYMLYHRGKRSIKTHNMFTGQNYNEYTGNGNVDLQKGPFDIRFQVNPVCGANFRYTYKYEYFTTNPDASGYEDDFQPNKQKCWHFQNNKNLGSPYFARDCTSNVLENQLGAVFPKP